MPNIRTFLAIGTIASGFLFAPLAWEGRSWSQPAGGAEGQKKTEKFQGWEVRCFGQAQGCVAASDTKGAQVLVARQEQKKNIAIVVHIPPTAKQNDPVAMHLDSGVTLQFKVWKCEQRFCEAPVNRKAVNGVLLRLIADRKGVIAYRLDDRMYIVPVSFEQFGQAWKAARG